ncbi:hypothetical protein TNCV_2680561 [Trichonephila clavipes]|uniref:Uncharacterized protein n=1 Tax=Trichonephila clavipes TaxID=2585209 RepID=A0A8X6VGA1_TRICX|nr:hypothetical protein TNCV_2680561 [Trichonephila clavipes]
MAFMQERTGNQLLTSYTVDTIARTIPIGNEQQVVSHYKWSTQHRDWVDVMRSYTVGKGFSQEQLNGTNKTLYNRVKQCRERKRMNAAERNNDGASTSAAGILMHVDYE